MRGSHEIESASVLADRWATWCGEKSQWVKWMRRFAALGGQVCDWGGVPQCHSSIGLTFELFAPDGTKLECEYRLKDIRAAVRLLENFSNG